MCPTPDRLKEKIVAYYRETNEKSYLANWSGTALSYHLGLADEKTGSLDEAHINTNLDLSRRLGIRKGMDVLDAGCGVGGTSIWLAKELGARVVGITIDPEQVAFARRFAKERGVAERTEFHAMDYAATSFCEASFDVVFNLESLAHCFDTRQYFEHVRYLLRDGGRYGCMETFAGSGRSELVQAVKDGWVQPEWQTMDQATDALRAAGFEDVASEDMTAQVTLTSQQMRRMAKNTEVLMKLERAMGGQTLPVFDGHLSGAIAVADGLSEGAMTYGFVGGRRAHRLS
jgi:tocopherol O-methyltransferase